MKLFSKIILIFLSLSIFLFLIFFTFIINFFSTFEELKYEKTSLWLFEINVNEKNRTYIKEIDSTNTWWTLIKKINISDEIIYSSWSTEPILKESTIYIEKWIYFFNLRWINQSYNIKWAWFEISDLWVWMFIINTLNPKQNIIFSVSSILNLNLKNKKTDSHIISIDLFPNIYLIFDPSRNTFVRNSDLLKVSQTFTLDFFNNKILNEGNISEWFLNLVSLKNEPSKKVIINSINFIKAEYFKNNLIIEKFLNSNIWYIPSEEFINKYFLLFINKNKKSLYYKNVIIREFHEILLYDKIINADNIINNYKLLKELNPDSAKEIEEIMISFYNNIIKSNKSLSMKINTFNILKWINNTFNILPPNSTLWLEEVFFKYNFLEKDNFIDEIIIFKSKYFQELNKKEWKTIKIEKVDYFLFFLEKILLSNYSWKDSDIKNLMYLFNDYAQISNSFYNYSNEKIKKTWLLKNSKILNKFKNNIEKYYFNEERNKNWLLTLKNTINIDDLLLLEKNINKLIEFKEKNINILKPEQNNNDKFLIKHYSILSKKYKEYFSALKNYNLYIIEYDKTKTDLLTTNTVNEWGVVNYLSIEKAYSYIANFEWIKIDELSVQIMDYSYCLNPNEKNRNIKVLTPYCYKIENLIIPWRSLWKKMSFLLHPFQKNKIDEIVIYNENTKWTYGIGEINKWSYKLDEIKKVLDKKSDTKSDDDEEEEKYNFYSFFVDTFWEKYVSQIYNNSEIIKEEIIEEEPIVKVFKRNKLLWENWDFANLEWFIDISYKDLLVEKIGENYSIELTKSIFNIRLSSKEVYKWFFSSNYNFSPDHSFINPRIKLINIKTGKDLLLWNYIYIKWKYKVNLIKEEIKKVFKQYWIINSITTNISQILRVYEIEIIYNKNSNKISFNLKYLNDNINIKVLNWNIIELNYKNSNIIDTTIPYNNLPKILNNIINK